jgi:hypothetical protein
MAPRAPGTYRLKLSFKTNHQEYNKAFGQALYLVVIVEDPSG